MKTNNAQGRLICIAVSGFMLAKCILNSVISGGFDAGEFGKALLCGIFLFTGLEYVNYVVAGLLAFVALTHFPANIIHIRSNFIYLLEGVLDIGCAVILCILPQVKEHFTNKWSEFKELFNK